MLECLFTAPRSLLRDGDACVFYSLSTFWASQLPKARFIWNWSSSSSTISKLPSGSFLFLAMLHLDCCPSLIHVLPMPIQGLRVLRTLEIMWCGDLREVFPLYTTVAKNEQQEQESATTTVPFKLLKRIHLHELPKMQGICRRWRIFAPELETVKIRGCWSLKRLPAVSSNGSKKVECDCEKECWDRLERRDPRLLITCDYKLTHPRYHKKSTILRGSVLR